MQLQGASDEGREKGKRESRWEDEIRDKIEVLGKLKEGLRNMGSLQTMKKAKK